MFTFLLVVQAIIAAALVAVILMQRSEGGGLGVGGSPAGLMSARGAADFLTRTTTVLATLFVGMSITLAVLASIHQAPSKIDTSLAKDIVPAAGAPTNAQPTGDALAGATQSVGNAATVTPGAANQSVPLVK